MTAACYDEAISRLLKSEGGYVNHPSDPGGPTNFGITLAVYRQNGFPNATASDIQRMDVVTAKAIYRTKYAKPVGFDLLPCGLDYAVFDYAVNSGIGRAPKVLRRVCGLADTADFSSMLTAIGRRDVKSVIQAYNDERLHFLQSLKTWPVFGKGWNARVASVNAAALHMAEHGSNVVALPTPRPDVIAPTPSAPIGKGEVVAPSITKPIATGGTLGGSAGGVSAWDWITHHPIETGAIVIIGGAVVIVGTHLAVQAWHRSTFATRQEAPTPNLTPVPERKAA